MFKNDLNSDISAIKTAKSCIIVQKKKKKNSYSHNGHGKVMPKHYKMIHFFGWFWLKRKQTKAFKKNI